MVDLRTLNKFRDVNAEKKMVQIGVFDEIYQRSKVGVFNIILSNDVQHGKRCVK